jgi:hypothetical protein
MRQHGMPCTVNVAPSRYVVAALLAHRLFLNDVHNGSVTEHHYEDGHQIF